MVYSLMMISHEITPGPSIFPPFGKDFVKNWEDKNSAWSLEELSIGQGELLGENLGHPAVGNHIPCLMDG